MSPLVAPKTQRILPPEGTHIARLVRIIHIGTIMEPYMGVETEMNKLDFLFELVDELHVFKEGEEAKPFVVSREFTLSMGEKANLRKFVEGVIGKSMVQGEADLFDVESLLNKACLITIKHKTSKSGNIRAEVTTASPLMKGQKAKEPFNQPKLLTYTSWDQKYFESLPEFMRKKIQGSKEYNSLMGNVPDDGSVPF